nr:YheC/YheD family protein [Natranaerobius trueperi]
MPDIIYDRGSGFPKRQKNVVKEIRKKLRKDIKSKFINNRDYIGKWRTYKYLIDYDYLSRHLPYTIRYNSFKDILIMLKRYDLIFLKSYYCREGKQIISISKQREGEIQGQLLF